MNLVIMSGRMTADPELRYTASNTAVANFNLAVDRRDEEKNTDFFRCNAWKKTAELISNYCHKGDKITVRGRLLTRKWDDNEGKRHEVTEITVDEVEFGAKSQNSQPKPAEPPKSNPKDSPSYFGLDDEDGLPF